MNPAGRPYFRRPPLSSLWIVIGQPGYGRAPGADGSTSRGQFASVMRSVARSSVTGLGMRIYLSTAQDIDQVAARVKKAGIALDAEPHDTPWGSRAFEVTEPRGFRLTIASGD